MEPSVPGGTPPEEISITHTKMSSAAGNVPLQSMGWIFVGMVLPYFTVFGIVPSSGGRSKSNLASGDS